MGKSIANAVMKRLAPILLALVLVMGQAAFAAETPAGDGDDTDYLKSVMDMIKEQYGGSLTGDQLVQGAVKGMFGSMDPYTTFFTPAEADSFMETISGTFFGIGVALDKNGDYIVITKVYPATPAERAGIMQGDLIVEADGKSLIGKSTDEAVSLIKGQEGTVVKLGILRKGQENVRYVDVTRDLIRINPVQYEIRNGIGYIKLETFNDNTKEYITEALDEMDRNNITKIVLDLRNNPGGDVWQAVAVASKFVPYGLVTKLDYKSESYGDVEYWSYLEKPKYKLAVLVNEMSASASEIVSGAVQDTGAGKLVGTKTFGKAKFQGFIPILTQAAYEKYKKQQNASVVNADELVTKYGIFPMESEISGYTKITLGYYYTPNGRMIDGTGLIPDYRVDNPSLVNDIDINSVQKLSQTVKPGLNGQGIDVYNAEKILKLLGYSVDTPDMTLDARTFQAIKEFQKSMKGWSYGVLDFGTQKALNERFEKIMFETDKQYAKAVEVLNQK